MSISIMTAAKHLCELSGWKLTNLKLQKILYLCHMQHLGREQETLIDEQFEAWDYGPVIPSLYHDLKFFYNNPIKDVFPRMDNIPENIEKSIELIWNQVKSKSASELIAITHSDISAWSECYFHGIKGIPIPNEKIANEYNRRIKASQ